MDRELGSDAGNTKSEKEYHSSAGVKLPNGHCLRDNQVRR